MRIRGALSEDKCRSFVIEELELQESRYNVVSVMLVDALDFDERRPCRPVPKVVSSSRCKPSSASPVRSCRSSSFRCGDYAVRTQAFEEGSSALATALTSLAGARVPPRARRSSPIGCANTRNQLTRVGLAGER